MRCRSALLFAFTLVSALGVRGEESAPSTEPTQRPFLGDVNSPDVTPSPEIESESGDANPALRIPREEKGLREILPRHDSAPALEPLNVGPARQYGPAATASQLPATTAATAPTSGQPTSIDLTPGASVQTTRSAMKAPAEPLPPVEPSAIEFFTTTKHSSSAFTQQILNPSGRGYVASDAFPEGLTFEACGIYFFDFVYHRGHLRTDAITTTTLDIAVGQGTPFTVVLSTYNGNGNAGALPTSLFDPTVAQQWTLVSADHITGYSKDAFVIDATRFLNATNGGAFSVDQVGSNLVLNFTPVPEPETWAMLGSGMALVAALSIRRRFKR